MARKIFDMDIAKARGLAKRHEREESRRMRAAEEAKRREQEPPRISRPPRRQRPPLPPPPPPSAPMYRAPPDTALDRALLAIWAHTEEAKRRLRDGTEWDLPSGNPADPLHVLAGCRIDGYWHYPLDHRNNETAALWSCRVIETDEDGHDSTELREEVHRCAGELRKVARDLIRQLPPKDYEWMRRHMLMLRKASQDGIGGIRRRRLSLVIPKATWKWYSRNRLTRPVLRRQ